MNLTVKLSDAILKFCLKAESVIERSLEGFFSSITSVLQDTSRRILSQTNEVKHALTQVLENLSVFNSLSISTDKFVR